MSDAPNQKKKGGVNWVVLGIGLLLVVPLIAVLAGGLGTNPRGISNALEGREAPAFVLETLDGETVDLADYDGQPIVLNFWSSTCGPCIQEHPHFQQAATVYGPKGVVFLGVLFNDEIPNGKRFLKRYPSVYPTVQDTHARAAVDYGVAGVPETFIITRDGRIAHKFMGAVSYATLAQVLEPLL